MKSKILLPVASSVRWGARTENDKAVSQNNNNNKLSTIRCNNFFPEHLFKIMKSKASMGLCTNMFKAALSTAVKS